MKDYKSNYLEIINKMIKNGNNLLYITIKPTDVSLNELRYLVRKSIRDMGKSFNIPYPRYLSVIEISSDISKGRKYIKELGLHSHMFLDTSLFDLKNYEMIERIIHTTFEKGKVGGDIKIIEELYDINRLKGYHLKQSQYLSSGFIDTNIPEYDKKLDRVIKYLHNITYSYSVKNKIEKIDMEYKKLEKGK